MPPELTSKRLLRRLRTRTEAGVVTLPLYSAGSEGPERYRVGYVCELGHAEVFRGADITVPRLRAIDADSTLAAVADFLSLRPGDTDPEYFETYTPEQLEFADSCAEALSLLGDDLRRRAEDPSASTVDGGVIAGFGDARRVLRRLRDVAGAFARTVEILQLHLESRDLDETTLGELADILDAAIACRATTDVAVAGLAARHGHIADAASCRPHPAKTSFYRHT